MSNSKKKLPYICEYYVEHMNKIGDHKYKYPQCDAELIVKKGVHSPEIAASAKVFVEYLFQKDICFEGKDVIDIGCGAGVLGIVSLLRGAHKACFTDIDENSVANTKENIKKLGFTSQSEVRCSDLFNSVDGKYDAVIANFPTVYTEEYTQDGVPFSLYKNIYDPYHKLLIRFFEEVSGYLKEDGIIYFLFPTSLGKVDVLMKSVRDNGLYVVDEYQKELRADLSIFQISKKI